MNRKIKILRKFLHDTYVSKITVGIGRQQHYNFLAGFSISHVLEHVDIENVFFRNFLILVCHFQSGNENFYFFQNLWIVEAQYDVTETLSSFMATT